MLYQEDLQKIQTIVRRAIEEKYEEQKSTVIEEVDKRMEEKIKTLRKEFNASLKSMEKSIAPPSSGKIS